MSSHLKPVDFHNCVSRMRAFFISRGFIEVHPQSTQSIFAECEDPKTISAYRYGKDCIDETVEIDWKLPKTGQMLLDHTMINNPTINGCFVITGCYTKTSSYHNKLDMIPGCHETVFPMFEFESKGDMDDLVGLEKELLYSLGFEINIEHKNAQISQKRKQDLGLSSKGALFHGISDGAGESWPRREYYNKFKTQYDWMSYYPEGDYTDVADIFNVEEIGDNEKKVLCDEEGAVFFLKNFPRHTLPFWNIKMEGDIAKKVDVVLHGQETIVSAEKSCDKGEMRDMFGCVSESGYDNILYDKFTKDQIDREFSAFMEKDFFPRYSGGIGITRMIRALKMSDLIKA